MTTPFTMVARAGTHVCCYLYPAYASYKAINLPDDHPEALEQVVRWLMYWGVVGTWTAIEGVVGWMFSWLPFYSIVKFGFFLWLALPQTQGSTYIYRTQLAPIFEEHEPDVDAFLQSLSGRATVALSNGAAWLWEKFRQQIGGVAPVNGQDAAPPGYDLHQQYPAGMQQPPSLQDPASGAAQQLYGFMSKYAGQYVPVAIAALSSAANATRNQQHPAPPRAQRSVSGSSIAAQVPETIAMPIPHPNREPSDPNLRSRTYLHAQNAQNAQGSSYPSGVSSSRSSRNFTAPSGSASLSQRSSQESVQTRSSGLEGRRDTGSFEQIQRDEIAGLPEGEARPEVGKRRSSWFGGWGTPERQKAE